jgi:chromosome partitioning protein
MKKIAVVNLKGGVGKTLTAIAVAQVLHPHGKVAVLDLDPRASARMWAAGGELPYAVLAPWTSQPHDLDWLVIDTPPNDDKTLAGVASEADVFLIPLRAGKGELNRLQPTLEVLARAGVKESAQLGCLVMDAHRDNLTKAMPEALEGRDLMVAAIVPHRVAYIEADGFRIPEALLEPFRQALEKLEVLPEGLPQVAQSPVRTEVRA